MTKIRDEVDAHNRMVQAFLLVCVLLVFYMNMQVLVEIVDLPKTFNTVYGIGPGNRLDSEMSVYMKSQGWPEQAQVG